MKTVARVGPLKAGADRQGLSRSGNEPSPSLLRGRKKEISNMLARRFIMAWKFKMWPWEIPWNTVKYLALDQRLTDADIRRSRELADKYGWK
jgi:hypothetical protein